MGSPRQRFKPQLICLYHKFGRKGRARACLGRESTRNINNGLAQTLKLPGMQELNFSTERSHLNESVRANRSLRAWMMVKVSLNRPMKLLYLISELVSPNSRSQSVGQSSLETENFTAANDV
jgi:hypothetical protein